MLNLFADKLISLAVLFYDLAEMILASFRDAFHVLRRGTRPVFTVFLRQLYFTGLQAFRIILVTSLIIGTVVITQIIGIAGAGSESLTGKVMVWIVVREVAPLLTAIVVIARSGTAIAAELSQMKIGGEIEALEIQGIPAATYLVMPRIFGVTAAIVILTVYFQVAALMGGFLVASVGWHLPWVLYSQGVFSVLTIQELALSLIKSAMFGLLVAGICCRQGLGVGRSVTHIPMAVTHGVMQSLFVLFVIDGVMSLFFIL